MPARLHPAAATHIAITGASSGIGAALARHYAGPGVRLSLLARDGGRLEQVAATCRGRGAAVTIRIGTVTAADEMDGWIAATWNSAPIDLLVANAGIGGTAALAQGAAEPPAKTADLFATNMLGVAHVAAPALTRMAARGTGQIAIVSSMAALFGLPQAPGYSASKAAVATYGDALRRQARHLGVAVAVIYPGFVDTPMSAGVPYRGLFLWDADRAARHIAARLARGDGRILCPWPMAAMARLARLFPTPLADAILARAQR